MTTELRPPGQGNGRTAPSFGRTVTLRCAQGQVFGRVCDNVHDFTVTVFHDHSIITHVAVQADRFPWTTCPIGIGRLKRLEGMPIAARMSDTVDQTQHCTHMLDIAKLAVRHAVRGGERVYTVAIEACEDSDACIAKIHRDGESVFRWRVVKNVIDEPATLRGHETTGRADWPSIVANDPDLQEAALILRRSLLVYRGRRIATARVHKASDLKYLKGVCLSFQPEFIGNAVRPDNFVDLD
jgi:Protein of unknown function (DUF2889)